jgi:hypothetical protein
VHLPSRRTPLRTTRNGPPFRVVLRSTPGGDPSYNDDSSHGQSASSMRLAFSRSTYIPRTMGSTPGLSPKRSVHRVVDTETGECGERRLNHSEGEAEKFYRALASIPRHKPTSIPRHKPTWINKFFEDVEHYRSQQCPRQPVRHNLGVYASIGLRATR